MVERQFKAKQLHLRRPALRHDSLLPPHAVESLRGQTIPTLSLAFQLLAHVRQMTSLGALCARSLGDSYTYLREAQDHDWGRLSFVSHESVRGKSLRPEAQVVPQYL